MSAHAGIFHRDGAPSHPSELEICLPFLDRLGPEGGDTYVADNVSFAHRIYRVTPESFEERSPHADARGLVTTWDGRIDNREDLALQLRDAPPTNLSDAAYAHAAFARWGAEAFSRLLGEWAMAVWDPSARELTLARDYTGAGPLFYYITPRLVLWSSELEAVVAMANEHGLCLNIDEGWIAGALGRGPELTETPYCEIRAVEPGHFVRCGLKSLTSQRHTYFDTRTVIRYRNDAEYEYHLRHLLKQSIACRLRCVGKVFSHLSGGLDSSTVTAMAAHLARNAGPSVELETLSSVYSDTPASDESEYIGMMEEWLGLPSHRISESDYPALTAPELGYEPASPSAIDVFATSQKAVRRAMQEAGARVQLSGEGGDELFGNAVGGVLQIRDLLQQRSWRPVRTALLRWSLSSKCTQCRVASDVLLSFLPNRLAARLESNSPLNHVGSVLTDDFKRRNSFRTRLHQDSDPFGFETYSQQARSAALSSIVNRISACTWRRIGPMVPTYPMLDRRLVAYLFAIPMDQIALAGSPRSLQRRAFRSLLPPKLLIRRSKRSPDAALYRRFLANTNLLDTGLRSTLTSEYGIVDMARLEIAIQEVKRGIYPVSLILGLLRIALWLRWWTTMRKAQSSGETTPLLRGKEVRI